MYFFLITDAYSRKIVEWELSLTLEAEFAVNALKRALAQVPLGTTGTIHHSDRGAQYCSGKYVNMLKINNISISMTQTGDPRDNAIAEQVNGILKTEWLNDIQLNSFQHANNEVDRVIDIYNNKRLHCSIDMLTPSKAHQQTGVLKKRWKNYQREKHLAWIEEKMLECVP